MFQPKVVEEIKTHILCPITFFFFLRNFRKTFTVGQATVKYGACTLHARYLRLQHILTICNTCYLSTATVVHERASMLRYT